MSDECTPDGALYRAAIAEYRRLAPWLGDRGAQAHVALLAQAAAHLYADAAVGAPPERADAIVDEVLQELLAHPPA